MSEADDAAADIDQRIEGVVDDADLGPIAEALARRRGEILAAWLKAALEQPFHADNPTASVADHIPVLLDNIIGVLRTSDYRNDLQPPMDDPAVIDAAKAHAQMRFDQGLGPVAIVTEFRLLRHEIGRALIASVDDAPGPDLLAGQAVIDDALDGAATVGLDALSDRVESLREEFLATTVHDIRQPITLVTGSLDLAARWLGEPEFDRERITDVVKSAVVAVNEINIMLDTLGDASRLAMGALEPDPEPAKLDAIVADALALLDAETRRQIEFEPSADPLVGLWDPHLLRRVVSNLISNALKYSPGRRSCRDPHRACRRRDRPAHDPRPGHGSDHRRSRDRVRPLRAGRPRSSAGHPRAWPRAVCLPRHRRRARRHARAALRRARDRHHGRRRPAP